MRRCLLLLALCVPAFARVDVVSGKLPLAFEANRGQAAGEYKFVVSGPDYALLLSPSGALIRHPGGQTRIRLVGASRHAEVGGLEPLAGRVNYILGNRPARWLNGIQVYSRVRYKSVYPGVDLVFHGRRGELEFDFIVSPGANPSVIRLGFDGAPRLKIDAAGNLVLGENSLRLRKPVVYQDRAGGRRLVHGGYSLLGKGKVGFRLSGYQTAEPLVIDPVLSFSTFLGGSSMENGKARGDMKGAGIATDPDGNMYVTGSTESADFPATRKVGAAETGSSTDLFVAKFTSAGELVYSTRIGGSELERGFGIAVDSSGNAYVTGRTQSVDFPLVNPAQARYGGYEDAYALKLNPAGTQLVYSTYLGGSDTDFACGIAVDPAGNAYVTGDAVSFNFPVTPNALQRQYAAGGSDAFVVKLGPSGALAFATYLGGHGWDHGESVAVDGSGNAYVTGYTTSADFPTARPIQSSLKGPADVFVVKLNQAGSALTYSTYLGGADVEAGVFLAVDASGNAYVTGFTLSTDFPVTPGVVQSALKGPSDAFLVKLNPAGSAAVFSTFLGGTSDDVANGVAVDAAGNSYVIGLTKSPDFPVASAFQPVLAGYDEAFVSKLNATGSQLVYSSFLGGSGWDWGYAIALDRSGNAYVTGRTTSVDFPVLKASQPAIKGDLGDSDAFIARIAETAPSAAFVSVSAASFTPAAPLAPGAIAAGFGQALASATESAATVPLPTTLAGTGVQVRDSLGTQRSAPLFFVSPGQINFLVPEGTATGQAAVTVLSQGQSRATGLVEILRVAPGLFSANADGRGAAAAIVVRYAADGSQSWDSAFQCGSAVGSCLPKPIDLGPETDRVYLQLFGTGIRGLTSREAVTARVGGVDAEVQFAGPQGGYAGLDQVNILLPRSLRGRGEVDVILTVDGRAANPLKVSIR